MCQMMEEKKMLVLLVTVIKFFNVNPIVHKYSALLNVEISFNTQSFIIKWKHIFIFYKMKHSILVHIFFVILTNQIKFTYANTYSDIFCVLKLSPQNYLYSLNQRNQLWKLNSVNYSWLCFGRKNLFLFFLYFDF